jgi:SAM-dependent methyltransferase
MKAGYDPERESCPLCFSPGLKDHYLIEQWDIPFSTSRCSDCGFIFMNPPLDDHTIDALYGKEYYSGEADYSYHDERIIEEFARHVWRARVRKLARHAPAGNFLDVGASFGGLMAAAEEHFTPYGIEKSEFSGRYAGERFPGRVHVGTLEDHPFKPGHFSAITMIELIEHLKEPPAALETCYDLLKPGGILLVQTANMEGLQARLLKEKYAYYMPGHLSYFSARNLEKALEGAGFGRVRFFYPVEFGLAPKLKKSRGDFTSRADYTRWLRIALYHLAGKVHTRYRSLTSSMVLYAWK